MDSLKDKCNSPCNSWLRLWKSMPLAGAGSPVPRAGIHAPGAGTHAHGAEP